MALVYTTDEPICSMSKILKPITTVVPKFILLFNCFLYVLATILLSRELKKRSCWIRKPPDRKTSLGPGGARFDERNSPGSKFAVDPFAKRDGFRLGDGVALPRRFRAGSAAHRWRHRLAYSHWRLYTRHAQLPQTRSLFVL